MSLYALNADNHSWVLSRMAVEFDCQPGQYTDYTIATWINESGRVLSTRNFTLTDAAGNEFGRAVTQWAMIDLKSRSALDLSWVGDAHAARRIEDRRAQRRDRGPEREIHILRFDTVIIMRFFSHVIDI